MTEQDIHRYHIWLLSNPTTLVGSSDGSQLPQKRTKKVKVRKPSSSAGPSAGVGLDIFSSSPSTFGLLQDQGTVPSLRLLGTSLPDGTGSASTPKIKTKTKKKAVSNVQAQSEGISNPNANTDTALVRVESHGREEGVKSNLENKDKGKCKGKAKEAQLEVQPQIGGIEGMAHLAKAVLPGERSKKKKKSRKDIDVETNGAASGTKDKGKGRADQSGPGQDVAGHSAQATNKDITRTKRKYTKKPKTNEPTSTSTTTELKAKKLKPTRPEEYDELDSDEMDELEIDGLLPSSPILHFQQLPHITGGSSTTTRQLAPEITRKSKSPKGKTGKKRKSLDSSAFDEPSAPVHLRNLTLLPTPTPMASAGSTPTPTVLVSGSDLGSAMKEGKKGKKDKDGTPRDKSKAKAKKRVVELGAVVPATTPA